MNFTEWKILKKKKICAQSTQKKSLQREGVYSQVQVPLKLVSNFFIEPGALQCTRLF